MKVDLKEEEWVVLMQSAQLGGNVMQLVLGIHARPMAPILEEMNSQLRAEKEKEGKTPLREVK